MATISRSDSAKSKKSIRFTADIDKQDSTEHLINLDNMPDSDRTLLLWYLEHIYASLDRYTVSLAEHRAFLSKPLSEYPPSISYLNKPPRAFLSMRYAPSDTLFPPDAGHAYHIHTTKVVAEKVRKRLQKMKKLLFPDPLPRCNESVPQPVGSAEDKAILKAGFSKEYLAKIQKGLNRLKKDNSLLRDFLVTLIAEGQIKDGLLDHLSSERKSLSAKELKKKVMKCNDMFQELSLQVEDMLEMRTQTEMAIHERVLQIMEAPNTK